MECGRNANDELGELITVAVGPPMTAGRAERSGAEWSGARCSQRESTKRGSHTMVVMSLLLAARLRESRRTSSAIARSRRRSRDGVCEVLRRFQDDGADEPARAGRRDAARRVALRRDSRPSSEPRLVSSGLVSSRLVSSLSSRLVSPHRTAPRDPESRRFQDLGDSREPATKLSRYRNYAQS